jgi:hypothetical protein
MTNEMGFINTLTTYSIHDVFNVAGPHSYVPSKLL